jgi:hypothetical protein
MLRRLGAFVTMLIEPTTAESMYSRITESTVYEPAEDATSEERFFYTVFNEVMLQVRGATPRYQAPPCLMK